MDATYCILWIDDQPRQLDGVVLNLTNRLALSGLEVSINWVTDFSDESMRPIIAGLRSHSPYDLIMVDYDLGNGVGGDTLAKRIRNATYGDMVFYSAASDQDLRRRLFDQSVDGVFCMNRDKLASEVHSLAKNAIRRVLHPNYMRGLVVGSVGEFDAIFSDTISAIIAKKGTPTADDIRQRASNALSQYVRELQEKDLRNIESRPPERIIKSMNLRVKLELLLELLDADGSKFCMACHEVLSRFLNEINSHRIEFAHARTTQQNGIPVFKDRNQKVWGPDDMKGLLVKIREHYNNATSLYDFFK